MPRSMTGFGRGTAQKDGLSVTVELTSVNHRNINLHVSGSRSLPELEIEVRNLLGKTFARGSFRGSLQIDTSKAETQAVRVHHALALQYQKALNDLSQELNWKAPQDVGYLLGLPGVVEIEDKGPGPELLKELAIQATHQAMEQLQEQRQSEGDRLAENLLGHLDHLATLVEKVSVVAGGAAEAHRTALQGRLADLLANGDLSLKAERLEMEVALLADRSDVNEEIERLHSHLAEMRPLLLQNQPVGRKLDFLCQEVNRECNTISSKSFSAELAHLAVEMKTENERIREQVQNIE